MPAQHAPSGGITIRGVDYVGGQFIPGDVIDDLSDDERKKLEDAHEEGADDEEPDEEDEEIEPEDDEEPEEEEDPDAKSFDTVAEAFAAFNRHGKTNASDAINHLAEFTQEHPDLADRGDWPSLYFDPEVLKDINETFEHEYDPTDPDSAEGLEDLLQVNPALEPIIAPLLAKAKANPEYQVQHDPEGYLTDNYFADEDASDRVQRVKEIAETKESDEDFFANLPDDAQEAIADDLKGEYNSDRPTMIEEFMPIKNTWPVLKKVFESSKPAKPKKFNPKRSDYVVFDMSGVTNDEDFTKAAARYLGQTWHSADGTLLMMHEDAASELKHVVDVPYEDTSDEETIRKVWDSIGSYAVSHTDVPAGAKNYGGTSGGIGGEVEHDWDPDNVDVYAQFSPNWFILRRGNHNPDVAKKAKYEFVERSKKPMTVGLPEPYWSGLSATDPNEYDDSKHDTKQERMRDTTQRRVAKTKFKDAKKQLGQIKAEAAHAHNLVKSAEAQKEAISELMKWTPKISNSEVDDFHTALKEVDEHAGDLDNVAPDEIEVEEKPELSREETPKEHTDAIAETARSITLDSRYHKKDVGDSINAMKWHFDVLNSHYDDILDKAEDATNSVKYDIESGDINPDEGDEELEHITRIAGKVKTLKARLGRLKLPQQ